MDAVNLMVIKTGTDIMLANILTKFGDEWIKTFQARELTVLIRYNFNYVMPQQVPGTVVWLVIEFDHEIIPINIQS